VTNETFVDDFYQFYGPCGSYPMNITRADILAAIEIVKMDDTIRYLADSVDRERVRDVLNSMGFQFLSQ
jgi:hypothetical protein